MVRLTFFNAIFSSLTKPIAATTTSFFLFLCASLDVVVVGDCVICGKRFYSSQYAQKKVTPISEKKITSGAIDRKVVDDDYSSCCYAQ